MNSDQKYQSCLDFMFRQLPMYQRVGKQAFKKNLKNILALCKYLGNPQEKFKSIHVAGTNGKGSTTHILSALFQSKFEKIGVYTSPHYLDFRERIKVNTDLISKTDVISFLDQNMDYIIELKPSFFEITVAMAFQHFAAQDVDIAIIETGLGGRLDSTNIISPMLSVITNIGLDHTDMLGDTLAQIASEKAGIIKQQVPVIIGLKQDSTKEVFINKAKDCQAEIFFAQDISTVKNLGVGKKLVTIKSDATTKQFDSNILGDFQNQNLNTAISTMLVWNKYYPNLSINLDLGLAQLADIATTTGFIGRCQIIGDKPKVMIDSAHNSDGIQALMSTINTIEHDQLHFVIGFVKDKDVAQSLALFPKDASYHLTQAKIPRAMNVTDLAQIANNIGVKPNTQNQDVRSALANAKNMAKENDLIVVCGSIFVVAEVL